MKPQRGDKDIRVTRADVAAAVHSVGVEPGDMALFHSSLSSMGTVVGGADAVIEGLLDAVGPTGTVAAPTLWARMSGDKPYDLADWDIDRSPSYPGKVTEAFRLRLDSIRSDNASHSVSAIGAKAVALTATHGRHGRRVSCFSPGAFAEDSPWQKLYDWNAAYCFIGVDFTVCTMRHFIECCLVQRALDAVPTNRHAELEAALTRWGKPGVWPIHNGQAAGERLSAMGLVRFGKIGSATLRAIRTRDMVDHHLAMLEAEPRQWFNDAFLAWLDKAAPSHGAKE